MGLSQQQRVDARLAGVPAGLRDQGRARAARLRAQARSARASRRSATQCSRKNNWRSSTCASQRNAGPSRGRAGQGAQEDMFRKLIALLAAPAVLGAQQMTRYRRFDPISIAEALRLAKREQRLEHHGRQCVRSANNSVRAARAAALPDAHRERGPEQERGRPLGPERTRSCRSPELDATTPA